jgi:hypothetical protein
MGEHARVRRELDRDGLSRELQSLGIAVPIVRAPWTRLDQIIAHYLRDAVTHARFPLVDFIVRHAREQQGELNAVLHAHMGITAPLERRLIHPIADLLTTPALLAVYDGIDGSRAPCGGPTPCGRGSSSRLSSASRRSTGTAHEAPSRSPWNWRSFTGERCG